MTKRGGWHVPALKTAIGVDGNPRLFWNAGHAAVVKSLRERTKRPWDLFYKGRLSATYGSAEAAMAAGDGIRGPMNTDQAKHYEAEVSRLCARGEAT